MKKLSLQLLALIFVAAMALSMLALVFSPAVLRGGGQSVEDAGGDESGTPPPDDTEEGAGTENSPSSPEEEAPAPPAPEPEPVPEETNAVYIRSRTDGLSVRSGAGTNYGVLGHINRDDMLHYVGKKGSWYETVYKNKRAYISAASAYTELFTLPAEDADERVEAVIEEGVNLLGFVYVYGAIRLHDGNGNLLKNFDATKYDCSSLMQYIFYHGAGINLNMTTRTQVKQGSYVAKSKIERGDLLFFTNSSRYNKTGVERIGHVALYLGDNYILHTASDYAVIEPISKTRWGYYIEARRVF